MELEMKKCKECGKLFTPKSPKQKYCEDLHYRPCPVCGKLVEAKYLSDPSRCCSKECRKELSSRNKPSKPTFTATPVDSTRSKAKVIKELQSDNLDEYTSSLRSQGGVRRYVGTDGVLYFKHNHEYALEISKRPNEAYSISAYFDLTDNLTVDLFMNLSSEISINHNFQ